MKALPGVEDPGSGSRRVPQSALKWGFMAVHFVCIWHLVGLDHEAVGRDWRIDRVLNNLFYIVSVAFPSTIVPKLRY